MSARILIVDDEVAFCELCSLWLQQAGYQVETCFNLPDGLAKFQQANDISDNNQIPFDLVGERPTGLIISLISLIDNLIIS